jgi:hypothetical protein
VEGILFYCVESLPCNEEKERKEKIEIPSGRDFSAESCRGEVLRFASSLFK